MAKVIAVLGSTGGQGGGLCRAILADPSSGFSCRAVTRDPNKDKAKALAAAGAEVVAADLDDVESLKKAFAGAYGVYAVTNFWEHFSGQKEKDQAKNIAEAAKAAGVQHIVWSTLEDTRQWMPAGDTRMGLPEYEAKRYEGRVKNGGVLLSVHCSTSDEVTRAKAILEQTGADDIASSGEKRGEEAVAVPARDRDRRLM